MYIPDASVTDTAVDVHDAHEFRVIDTDVDAHDASAIDTYALNQNGY